jgi:hypothetical protein
MDGAIPAKQLTLCRAAGAAGAAGRWQEEVVWSREEALAAIRGTLLTELPPERHLGGVSLGAQQVVALEHSLEDWLQVSTVLY